MNLSSTGLWSAAVIVLFGVVAQWLPGDVGSLWQAPALLWLAALAVEGWLARRTVLTAQWLLPPRLRLGRAESISLQLSSHSSQRLSAEVFVAAPEGADGSAQVQRVQIDASGVTLTRHWTPRRLGTLTAPPLQLRLLGRLRLAWWSRRLPAAPPQRVQPDVFGTATTLAGRKPGRDASANAPGAGTELLGLRDYQPGDPLRAMAWRASARRGRMLIREMAAEQQLDVMIVIDAGRAGCQKIGALTRLHHAVNAAARLAQRATTLGDHVGLIVYDGGGVRCALAPAGGHNGLRRLQQALAGAVARSEDADPMAAALALRRLCRRRSLALWFTDVDSGASSEPLRDCVRLLVPQHLPLFAGLLDDGVQALAEQSPRTNKDAYVTLAATQALEASELQALTLRRRGCVVVRAAPAEIDAQVLRSYESLRRRRAV